MVEKSRPKRPRPCAHPSRRWWNALRVLTHRPAGNVRTRRRTNWEGARLSTYLRFDALYNVAENLILFHLIIRYLNAEFVLDGKE